MNGLIKTISMLATVALLSGCGDTDLERARHMNPVGSDFARSLYKGYLRVADAASAKGEHLIAAEFAKKAIIAARGRELYPSRVIRDFLPPKTVAKMAFNRRNLIDKINAGARTKTPQTIARAQVMFDCWLKSKELDNSAAGATLCQRIFAATLAKLDQNVRLAKASRRRGANNWTIIPATAPRRGPAAPHNAIAR